MGRPREWDRGDLLSKLTEYVDFTDIPIVAEFAYQNDINRQDLYAMVELSDALKRCIAKKESALERKALSGDVNCSMAIFSLKQLGWKDTHEQTHKTDVPVAVTLLSSDIPPHSKAG